jgi:hypothetical protein
MDDHKDAASRQRAVAALRELIKALDRRVPHVERLGEERIAGEATALRIEAARRIEELNEESDRNKNGAELSDAVMTDDGAPLQRRK